MRAQRFEERKEEKKEYVLPGHSREQTETPSF